ncbi:MAG: hypothetical protein Q9222_004547 [Ikaeria aurantiellina]
MKRRREAAAPQDLGVDTSRPTAVFEPTKAPLRLSSRLCWLVKSLVHRRYFAWMK